MSVFGRVFQNEDGIPVVTFVFFCDGCGRVVRGKKWKGRHRLAIDPPPAGWKETMYGDEGEGVRIGWCSPPCEEAAINMTSAERKVVFDAGKKRLERAQGKLGRKILGLYPWEKAPWEKGESK